MYRLNQDVVPLGYDDVLLVPVESAVNSRLDVDLSVELAPYLKLQIPVVAAPMRGIISVEIIEQLSAMGGIGILHRFYESKSKFKEIIKYLQSNNVENFGVSCGLDESDNHILKLLDTGAKILCLDVANGYTNAVARDVDRLSDLAKFYKCLVMAGNVVTKTGVDRLSFHGASLVRVGIGSGALCTTRVVTGVGVPQFTAVGECSGSLAMVVADGGIRSSGDAVKAFVAGAKLVMIGSLLGQTYEADHNGIIYGSASRQLQEEYYHSVRSVEGISTPVEKRIKFSDFMDEFTWGLRSACTYLNASKLSDLRQANVIIVKR